MREQAMPAPPASLLVAVSGGIDSVVLLDVLLQMGYPCVVAHCNFHLRGDDSNQDAAFVEALAKKYGVPFRRIDFETEKVAHERKISIEMAARDLRYAWFADLLKTEKCTALAIAHNANDCAETMLLNLARGTGIDGLHGILPTNGEIIRPLLCCTRAEIEQYAESRHLQHREDRTNSDTAIRRNFVRHRLLPLFEEINPAFVPIMRRNAQNLTDVAEIYHFFIEKIREEICQNLPDGTTEIDTEKLLQQPASRTILYEILQPFGINSDTNDALFDSLHSVGATFCTASHRLLIDRGKIIVAPHNEIDANEYQIAENQAEISIPISLKIEKIDDIPEISKSPKMAYFDAEKVKFPLTLRRWRQGDAFVPFGMTGRKKVSDLFVDCKLSLFDKQNAWLLTSGNDILWVVGLRTDNRFRISKSTKTVLRLTYRP